MDTEASPATESAKNGQAAAPSKPEPEPQRVICEADVHILRYVRKDVKGFSAILKHRYSDFNVLEVALDGKVVSIQDTSLPAKEPASASSGDAAPPAVPPYAELTAAEKGLVTPLTWSRLSQMARKYATLREAAAASATDAHTVRIDITSKAKEERCELHCLIRRHFPHLVSNTEAQQIEGGEEKRMLAVKYKSADTLKRAQAGDWPRERPKYLHFTLYKEDLDSHFVFSKLGRSLDHSQPHRRVPITFGVCGMKDKRARTTQRVSVKRVTPKQLVRARGQAHFRDDRLGLGDFKYERKPLTLGALRGNRFNLVLRDVRPEREEDVATAMRSLADHGFFNYFGLQRFGTSSVRTSDVGLALIKQDWMGAIERILKPRANERPQLASARAHWWEHRNAKEALRILGRRNENTIEGSLLLGLKIKGENDLVGALDRIQRNHRLMYLHAYQSYVWNKVVSQRVEQHGLEVLLGDLFVEGDVITEEEKEVREENEKEEKEGEEENEKEEVEAAEKGDGNDKQGSNNKEKEEVKKRTAATMDVKVVTADNLKDVSIYDVVMPLPGYRIKYPENDTLKALYEQTLAEDGLSMEGGFRNKVDFYALGGDYRKMLGRVEDLEWKTVRYSNPNQNLVLSDLERQRKRPEIESEPDGVYFGLTVAFSLKSSHYATMAIRELLKTDTGRDHQAVLTKEHMEEYNARTGKKREAEDGEGTENGEGAGGAAKKQKVEGESDLKQDEGESDLKQDVAEEVVKEDGAAQDASAE